MAEISFQHIFDINQLFKKKGIEYSIHLFGDCSSCGAYLLCEGENIGHEELEAVMNEYFKEKWLKIYLSDDLSLRAESLLK